MQTTTNEKKMCACPNIENSSKNVFPPFKPCGNGCVFLEDAQGPMCS
jgi:hypothetical protein